MHHIYSTLKEWVYHQLKQQDHISMKIHSSRIMMEELESCWKNLHHKLHKNVLEVMWQNSHWVLCYMIWRSTMGKEDKRKYAYKLGRFSEPPQSITLPKLLKIWSSEFRMFIWTEIRMFMWMEFIIIMNINPEYIHKY